MSPRRPPPPAQARSEQQREYDRAERARHRAVRSQAGREDVYAVSSNPAGEASAPPAGEASARVPDPPPGAPEPAGGALDPAQPSPPSRPDAYDPPLPPPGADAPQTFAPPPGLVRASALHGSRGGGRRGGRRALAGVTVALALVVLGVAAWLAVDRKGQKQAPPVAAPVVVRVLIPEGETRAQIALRAHGAGLRGSYLRASERSPLVDPARYGAPAHTASLEGFLFPATYDLYRGDPAGRLVREQLVAFAENFGDAELSRARALRVTPYQLLTVASIIEREAQLAGDRAKVAAVIYNRLRLGMPLGVDATIRYALNDYTQPLTQAQLSLASPYNTRLRRGLPPTPISNPGLAAIDAAGHPAHVGYLYYVSGADGCGEQVFSTSAAQFERDAAVYHRAVSENGGRVPTCHKRS